ncbi:hypothetical protein AB6A40_009493 [Gnathostoma spinigerum]|uniref:acid phosphatase n=1 Tax=Gnathostoma spinigerum TaxID=75299 RepID=A0ABD6ES42_9BILA
MNSHNISLPEWVTPHIYNRMAELSWIGLQAEFGIGIFKNEVLRKLRGGSILKHIAEELSKRVECELNTSKTGCQYTFYGISGHDLTVLSLLSNFRDIDDLLGEVPLIGYCANLVVELWRVDGKFFISVVYTNSFRDHSQVITSHVPGCEIAEVLCSLEDFLTATKDMYFRDVRKACKSKKRTVPIAYSVIEDFYERD